MSPAARSTLRVLSDLAVLAVWIACAVAFAAHQEIWVDETTQLSGLTLGFSEVADWLTGTRADRFGVPDDRMPPLSYWVGSVWASWFGLGASSLRALGITATCGTLLFVMAAARRAFGGSAALIAGLALAFSPNTIVAGIEIRAYPLFLLASAAAFYFLVRLHAADARSTRGAWLGLAIACGACVGTHFFGVVLSGAVLLAAACQTWLRRERPVGLVGAGLCVIASVVFILPFVRAAAATSEPETGGEGILRDFARLAYRLLGGHPSVSVHSLVKLGVLGGAGVALVVSLARALTAPTLRRLLALAVGAGGLVAIACRLVVRSFDSLSPSYNLWMLPPIALLIGASISSTRPRWRALAWLGVTLHLAGTAAGAIVLLSHGPTFAHTAAERIAERIVKARTSEGRFAVVHDSTESWGHTYLPLRYLFGKDLPQYLARAGADGTFTIAELPDLERSSAPADLPFDKIVVVHTQKQDAEAIREALQAARGPLIPATQAMEALRRAGWTLEDQEVLAAMEATRLEWMRRAKR